MKRWQKIHCGGRFQRIGELVQDLRGVGWIDASWRDVRYGLHLLVRNPGVTAIGVLSLALGITLNCAIFSVVDGMWLRPTPFGDPGRVVRVFATSEKDGVGGFSHPDYLELRAQMKSLCGLAAVDYRAADLIGDEDKEILPAEVVSRDFFTVLGLKPQAGQFFSEADEPAVKNTPAVVLSHRLWQGRFNGDITLVGKTLVLNGESYTVLGIAPPGFNGTTRGVPRSVWFPIQSWGEPDRLTSRQARDFSLVGRLAPGCRARHAQAEADTIFRRLDLKDRASGSRQTALVMSEARHQFEEAGERGLLLLSVVVALLLLACANVSSLLLARAEVRGREMAVRFALGGKRLDLIRQLLAESFLLSLIALIASILLAKWIISALPSLLPADWTLGARLDGRVITFTAAVSLLTVFLFGLAPALHASRPSLLPLLKSDLAPRSLGRKHRGLNAVVIAQMSVGLVLVSIAMLLTRSVLKLYWGDLGFERKGVLLAYLRMPDNQQEGRLFCRQLIERIRGLPGVRQVSMARIAPFSPSGSGASQKVFLPQDQAATEQAGWAVKCNTIDPNYFRLLGIPIVRGRSFTDADNESSPRVVVINESMARRFWPNEDPVGQQIRLSGPSNQSVHIVGVVRDGKYVGIRREPEPYLFLPFAQVYSWETVLLVETGIEMATLARSVRKELRGLGVTLSRSSMSTLREHIRAQVSDQEILAKALAFFGLLGLGLASVGLYGILAYAISRRTQEIGIRMALGAQRGDLLKSILREGLGLALIGSIVGLSVAVAVARVLRSFLYRVNPLDPLSLAISSLLLLGVALLATYFPARRAAKVNPMVALRYE